ncbi:GntR family transcriptional regulator [Bacillus safensis FO-36b] [Bacillus safensis subsp. safensis]
MHLATKELITSGHQQIGVISETDDLQEKYRMKGYIQALGEAKLNFLPEHVLFFDTESKQHLGEQISAFLMAHRHELTALVCYNDEVGLEVANVCSEIGLSIPDDLSIIGQDNSDTAEKNAHVKLTTLTHPQEQMGRDAADWMIKKVQGI